MGWMHADEESAGLCALYDQIALRLWAPINSHRINGVK